MLSWFTNRRRLSNRKIFRYWDGSRERACDPGEAWRAMWSHPECSPQNDFGPAMGEFPGDEYDDAAHKAALDRVLRMTREMFGVLPWTENSSGLTVAETLSLLWDFLRYMDTLKKKRDQSLMTSEHTVSESSQPPSTIPFGSGSVSIETGSRSDAPSSSSKRSVRL